MFSKVLEGIPMIIKKVDDVFNIIQGHQITEEEIYNSVGHIPIYTGNNEKIGLVETSIVDKEDLPCISYPTKGNVGNFYVQSEIFNANNTAVLTLKDEWKGKINLYWAISHISPKVKQACNSKSGVGYIGKNIMKDITMEIPALERQERIGSQYQKNFILKEKIELTTEIYKKNLRQKFAIESKYKRKIKDVFEFKGGNSGLTKEFIYHNQAVETDSIMKIYSGSTLEENFLGSISKNAPVAKKENGPAILVTRKGYFAGTLSIIKDELFVINDDAYVMKLKSDWESKVNLRWFISEYQGLFFNLVTSKSDNATFSKTYVEEQYIDIPEISAQEEIAKNLEKYDHLLVKLEQKKKKLSALIDFQIT